jgi:hypothetical protein
MPDYVVDATIEQQATADFCNDAAGIGTAAYRMNPNNGVTDLVDKSLQQLDYAASWVTAEQTAAGVRSAVADPAIALNDIEGVLSRLGRIQ